MRVLLSGASGLIGRRLASTLVGAGHDVRRLVRRDPAESFEFRWDPYGGIIDARALDGVEAVIHMSGAGIGDRRWTPERKRVLHDSRVVTTRFLAETIATAQTPPAVMISQSAVGIYGDRGDEVLAETSAPGPRTDFLVALTMDWEEAAEPARAAGIRVVHPRTGIVLARDSQLMARLVPLFRAGLGGRLGPGDQWWSWITLADVIAALVHLLTSKVDGPVNVVAPRPVQQREFTRTLAKVVGRPALLPVPKAALRLALGGEKAEAIGFASTRAIPERLTADGFSFADPDLEPALRRLLD